MTRITLWGTLRPNPLEILSINMKWRQSQNENLLLKVIGDATTPKFLLVKIEINLVTCLSMS